VSKKFLLIVESPAKCKTIANYLKLLPDSYNVMATYGHIRSLPRRNGSVLPDENFLMRWTYNPNSKKYVDALIREAKEIEKTSGSIILATDADREGEAIAWHVSEVLRENGVNCDTRRMVFQEITKKSITSALNNLMDINLNKVNAYFSRLSLDYLVGFGLSPILWSKVRGCKSAGRVQSAALRAIVDREFEIIQFISQKYWDLSGQFTIRDQEYHAVLINWQNEPVTKFMWTEVSANEAKQKLSTDKYKVVEIEHKNQSQCPHPPFITSTLQQQASHEMNWNASFTMQVAQKLYEGVSVDGETVGLITYMRTDSMRIDKDILKECESFIQDKYGPQYAHMRDYSKKTNNAQDAHEAIRPTSIIHTPDKLKQYLDADLYKLYKLIWNRTIASQMSNAEYRVINIILGGEHGKWKIHLRDRKFDGFLKVIGSNDEDLDQIPTINEQEEAVPVKIAVNEHTTAPPNRFTEATLIKHLDEVGIGRPSTYVSVIETLQKREYIQKTGKKLSPMVRGWLVTGFLKLFCEEYVRDDFTAKVEEDLDKISQDEVRWKDFLHNFWNKFNPLLQDLKQLDSRSVGNDISGLYPEYFFGKKDRKCSKCEDGVKVCCITSNSVFIGCSNYPQCNIQESLKSERDVGESEIGRDPETNENIILKRGPYGYYLHWENLKKNVAVPAKIVSSVNLDLALKLKEFPKSLGNNPLTQKEIKLSIGQYGPYLSHAGVYASCVIDENLWTMTLNQALEVLGTNKKREHDNADGVGKFRKNRVKSRRNDIQE